MEIGFETIKELIGDSVKLDLIRTHLKSHKYITRDDLLMLLGESEEENNDWFWNYTRSKQAYSNY